VGSDGDAFSGDEGTSDSGSVSLSDMRYKMEGHENKPSLYYICAEWHRIKLHRSQKQQHHLRPRDHAFIINIYSPLMPFRKAVISD
jgi:hypothetical protein